MNESVKLTRNDYRNLAKDRARSEGRKLTYIGQRGTVSEHKLYIAGTRYELAYINAPDNAAFPVAIIPDTIPTANITYTGLSPKPVTELITSIEVVATEIPEPVNPPLPVNEILPEPVKEPLPVPAVLVEVVKHSLPLSEALPEPVKGSLPPAEPRRKQKDVLANGRNKNRMPSFDQWHCRIFPKDITYPAWKHLTKTATDVANICKAKRDYSAAKNRKDSSGVPIFDFAFSEAVNIFRMTRPTFTSAIKLLLEIGFIEYSCPGGIRNGVGTKATYRLSDKWKSWEPPVRDNANITEARKHWKRPVKTKSQ